MSKSYDDAMDPLNRYDSFKSDLTSERKKRKMNNKKDKKQKTFVKGVSIERKEKIQILKALEKSIRKNDRLTDALIKYGFSIDSFAIRELGELASLSIKMASLAIVDKYEWVSWHVYENDIGKKQFEAGREGKTKKVCSWDDLLDIIEQK